MSLQSCAELLERGDPDRLRAALAAPPTARKVLFPVYAFNLEIARAPWVTAESMIAEMRLQWWRDALEEIGQGARVRSHEVTLPLAEVLDADGAALLDGVIAARRWDVYSEPFEDEDHFRAYLDATSGNLAWAAARALGAQGNEAAVRDVAFASGLARFFQAVPDLQAKGRVPMVDGRPERVRAFAAEALDRLSRAGRIRGPARHALNDTVFAAPLLRLAQRDPQAVAEGRLALPEGRKRLRLILRMLGG
ncbi:squalene/phytoene synthase family protein [Anianabacter salinae]|uniref:squalene/phytoene synthase family protein n=1 Tax=Anianabacter salinae TaxID=2851023 RepID=UPI00225DF594|nr:squalene/phytoene synthase family protein [Anianabacter salinae]MBV0911920.1 squalene/phytoene synthase family protein [Anianabacter salinae]